MCALSFTVSNLFDDSSIVQQALRDNYQKFASVFARTITAAVASISTPCDTETTTSVANANLPAMQLCSVGAKLCLQLSQHMGDIVRTILWEGAGRRSSDGVACGCKGDGLSGTRSDFHQILQAVLDMTSSKVWLMIIGTII